MFDMRRLTRAKPGAHEVDRTGPGAGNIGYVVGFCGGRTLVPRSGASAMPGIETRCPGPQNARIWPSRSSAPKGRRRARSAAVCASNENGADHGA
jgi:hypothetical protein